jgi:hypothetical protein
MPHIVLTEEQARVVLGAADGVEVRDVQGRTVAHLTPLSAGDIEAIERYKRSRGQQQAGVPGEQVQAHFRRLHEIREHEGMDTPRALELLRRMRAAELA